LTAALLALALPALMLVAQEPPGTPGGGTTGRPGGGARAGTSLTDGTWTVVSASRNGKAMDNASKMTVTIRNNVVTFSGAGKGTGGGTDTTTMRNLRLDFAPQGMVRVTEAGADGKFGTPGGGTGTAPGAGTRPDTETRPGSGTPGAGTRPGTGTGTAGGGAGGLSGRTGNMSGVYVMTDDYLAISVFDARSTTPGGTDRPGTTPARPGDRPGTGTRPGAGGLDREGTRPGSSTLDREGDRPGAGKRIGDTADRPGAGDREGDRPGAGRRPGDGTDRPDAGDRPGSSDRGSTASSGEGPETRSWLSVILRRSGDRPGSSSGTRDTERR